MNAPLFRCIVASGASISPGLVTVWLADRNDFQSTDLPA